MDRHHTHLEVPAILDYLPILQEGRLPSHRNLEGPSLQAAENRLPILVVDSAGHYLGEAVVLGEVRSLEADRLAVEDQRDAPRLIWEGARWYSHRT